ncbi:uncharacterized protein LOC130498949 [Raphanus sativus]|uniref:Uncharacterized protein LOC130498949 n=1 Tax=Raphanus sativus TaxID=3726 RepID=A0A9W3CBE2_RAPSA|nr:uncharacterized protein LOC130498949 [Raphanus sativus]
MVIFKRDFFQLVFLSSTLYGWTKEVPCTEESPISATNPYGRTKLFIEGICRGMYIALTLNVRSYYLDTSNPVGAHPSGYIGEDSLRFPNNLMPYVQQVAVGRRPHLTNPKTLRPSAPTPYKERCSPSFCLIHKSRSEALQRFPETGSPSRRVSSSSLPSLFRAPPLSLSLSSPSASLSLSGGRVVVVVVVIAGVVVV